MLMHVYVAIQLHVICVELIVSQILRNLFLYLYTCINKLMKISVVSMHINQYVISNLVSMEINISDLRH